MSKIPQPTSLDDPVADPHQTTRQPGNHRPIDLERLADKVLTLLKEDLLLEQERAGSKRYH